ncbi:MAG: hypothetical protein IPJ77_21970 [Planctomycetes bacterium]|nr:hypothetical protein [Planctomycetota bacterium]
MTPFLSFDIEIANEFELRPGEDLDRYAPFDVSVAAVAHESGTVRHWHATDARGKPAGTLDARLAREVLEYLREAQLSGTRVFAWNGLSFDLRWLAHAAKDKRLAREVAMDLYDPMFQFATMKGFPIGLAAVADGLGIAQKKLMSADKAPVEWNRGNHQLVLDYVAGDCTLTNRVVAAIEFERCVKWRTKRGDVKAEPMRVLRPVKEVMMDPAPDQSWMSEPRPPSEYWKWLREERAAGA